VSQIAKPGAIKDRILIRLTLSQTLQLPMPSLEENVRLDVIALETTNYHAESSSQQIRGTTIIFTTNFQERVPVILQYKYNHVNVIT
jgi:hypothetical protein